VYTDPEGVIFGNATLGVRQWLRDNQVKISLPMNEPEDQFGLMLMTLSWSLRNGVDDAAVRDFLSNHLMTWAPYFLEVFLRGTDNPLYQGTGRLAAATLADWNDRFQLEVPKINLHRRD
jgi:TorA maturation chaperone TorD